MYVLHLGSMRIFSQSNEHTAVVAFGEPGKAALNYASTRQAKNAKVRPVRDVAPPMTMVAGYETAILQPHQPGVPSCAM